VWDLKYVALEATKSCPEQATTITCIHHLSFAVNGHIVIPLLRHQFSSILVSDFPPNTIAETLAEKTWIIMDNYFQEIKLSLLCQLQEDENTHSKIPLYGLVRDGAFPYTSMNPSGQYSSSILSVVKWFFKSLNRSSHDY